MKRSLFVLLTLVFAFIPGVALAQTAGSETGGLLVRVGGDMHVPAGERVDSVFVVNGNAVVDGSVHSTLWVIHGDATVSGAAEGDIMVVNGKLDLKPSATVKNISLIRSDLIRESGSTVTGSISERSEFVTFSWGLRWLFWAGLTLLVLAAGLLFAAIGGRQLAELVDQIGRRPAESILATVIVWIGLPILAVLVILTVIGIPLGIAMLVFLLPALGFIGYLVSGTALGALILRRLRSADEPRHPYLAALVGLLALQIVGFVPVIGGLVVMIAGLFGGGALAYRLWRGWRGERDVRAPTPRPG